MDKKSIVDHLKKRNGSVVDGISKGIEDFNEQEVQEASRDGFIAYRSEEKDMKEKKEVPKTVNQLREDAGLEPLESTMKDKVDTRYNEPKGEPKADEETIKNVIESNSIYKKAKETILKAQQKQVGYGLDKYPEPLNANSWDTVETIDHIMEESVDKLHYLAMLREKMVSSAGVADRLMLDKDLIKNLTKHPGASSKDVLSGIASNPGYNTKGPIFDDRLLSPYFTGENLGITKLAGHTVITGIDTESARDEQPTKPEKQRMDVMVDFKTLGTDTNATVIQIAAMAFDISNGFLINGFEQTVDISKNPSYDMNVSGSTLKWWMETDKELFAELLAKGEGSSSEAIHGFHKWLSELCIRYDVKLWGNGILFDNNIIRTQFESEGLDYPIEYSNDRDVRTISDTVCSMTGFSTEELRVRFYKKHRTKHNAMDDVYNQIDLVSGCWEFLHRRCSINGEL